MKPSHPGRIALVMVFIALWSIAILARLVQLQVLQHKDFEHLAVRRQQMTRSILPARGIIYDSHMDELASSVSVSTVAAEARRIQDKYAASQKLGVLLEMNAKELEKRFRDPDKQVFQFVKHRIAPQDEARIKSLNIDGIYLLDETMRAYPNRELASHILGFVNLPGDGAAGIELQYDKELKGVPGQISFDIDARRRSFRGRVEREPIQGHSLVLSIDRGIQYIADRELAAGVEKAHAAHGVAIVLESDTGRILALSSYPAFNLNSYGEYPMDTWRNRAVSDIFEPGSTFKVVVAAAALEAGLTRPDEVIDCQMGSITIGRHVFHDHKAFGLLTFSQILEFSSNVGATKLGLRLGDQRLYEGLRAFGFGSKSEVDLPGEIVGLVRDWRRWSSLSIGAISFGQEIGVTPVQILMAINSIANGGFRVRPSVVDRVIDHNGDLVRASFPARSRIMALETAAAVREAFEGVVLRGTGRAAALEGYRAAGKTGTAQKIENGRYSATKYVASFVGFAPLPHPRLTTLVVIDEPMGQHHGGEVAAPVFQKITQEALLRLRIPPDKTVPLRKISPALVASGAADYIPNATPVVPLVATGEEKPGTDAEEVIRMRVSNESVVMPDFRGMAMRQVVLRCQELKLQVQSNGSGIAVFQMPAPGTTISSGEACSVTFARGTLGMLRQVPGVDLGVYAQHGDPAQGRGSRP